MTRGQAAQKRRSAWDTLLIAWGLAVIPNALDASGVEMNGGWMVVRYVLSSLFLAALFALVVAFVRERRAPRDPVSE